MHVFSLTANQPSGVYAFSILFFFFFNVVFVCDNSKPTQCDKLVDNVEPDLFFSRLSEFNVFTMYIFG